jgi:hypothetical protein
MNRVENPAISIKDSDRRQQLVKQPELSAPHTFQGKSHDHFNELAAKAP